MTRQATVHPPDDLVRHLRPLARRLRFHDLQRVVTLFLWLPLLAAALMLLAGRVFPLQGYQTWAWIPLGAWLVGVLAFGLLRPLPVALVARRTDGALGLRNRLTTALELNYDNPARGARFDHSLVAHQHADALDVARGIDPARAFPFRWSWRRLAVAAACLVAVALLAYLPNPMDAVLEERAAIAAEAEAQADALEELAAELAADETLDADAREELLRRLQEAIEALRANPGDQEQALADLAELEERLRQQLDPQNAARQAALAGLAADLAALAGAEDRDPALEEAARLLQALSANASQMSSGEQDALARTLDEAAARLAGSDPGLAGALSQVARDVRAGQASESGAQSAAEGLSRAAQEAAMQQALAQALNQAREGSTALARAGRQGSGAQAGAQPGQPGGEGQAEGEGEGEGQGQGQGQGQGTTGGGGGTQSSSGPPSTRSGRAGEPTDPNRDYEVGELDTVVAPWQRGQPGDPDFLPGRETGEGEETVRENEQPQPGAPGAAAVPYADVYPSYAAAAAEAVERDYVPAGLREYVREYFSHLEP